MTATIKYLPPAAGAFDPTDITLTDDTSGAFLIKEGSNEYMRINTTNGAEKTIFKTQSGGNTGFFVNVPAAGDALSIVRGGSPATRVTLNAGTTLFQVDSNQILADLISSVRTFKVDGTNVSPLVITGDSNTTFTLDDTSGAVFKVVDDASPSNTYLKAVEAGSVSTERNFEIYNSTAPAASVTDGCILFCEDVSSSSELKVRDEAGNVTTLSPHNFSLIPEGASEEMAWSYYSEKDGKKINVDMLRLARLVEQISGEQIIFEEG